MSQIEINGSDTSTVHVLHLDLPPEAVERFTTMAGTGEWPLKYGLGATHLRPAFVETVDLRDLGPMRLSQYLTEAYDVPSRALGEDKSRIDALRGHAVILPPQAFEATSQTLHVASPLRHVGSYAITAARGRGAALRTPSAKGEGSGGAPVAGPSFSRPLLFTLVGLAILIVLGLYFLL
ncbi:hypothetical protein GGQ68_000594 [Sagittula marina]|uniref:Aspartate carbamoyltransferase catalytic subunit n=1 Tax=Sagittula marina TaxID=943940 RepID=A0A7W6DQQ4_9RHOB|nr:aspartate carbamoyltransferase catalytic subunit [Sagittula marina]MBB3984283.1 hypothetical protein [Sagittula marina]